MAIQVASIGAAWSLDLTEAPLEDGAETRLIDLEAPCLVQATLFVVPSRDDYRSQAITSGAVMSTSFKAGT